MQSTATTFDVAILDNGLVGSALAAVLARRGARVALISVDTHPRYTPGEIATPYTTALLRVLADRYDVPELAVLATARRARAEVSARLGTARASGFVYHRTGRPRAPEEVFQLAPPRVMPAPPTLYRQDTDAYVFHAACRYGATAYQQTRVADVVPDRDGVTVVRSDGRTIRARYVVDTGGRGIRLIDLFHTQEQPSRLRHRALGMATHMVRVRPFDEAGRAGRRHRPPVPWGAGPLHHVFAGGYLWVVPFGPGRDGTPVAWSVGASLAVPQPAPGPMDGAENPGPWRADPGEPAERRWDRLLDEFPDIGAQLHDARPVQPWTTIGSQPSGGGCAGDRWCAIGEAAGLVDPLMSRPLLRGLEAVNFLGGRLLDAIRADDFAAERFRFLNEFAQRTMDADDRLVHAFFGASADYQLWKAFLSVWEVGSFYGRLTVEHAGSAHHDGDGRAFQRLETAKYLGLPFPCHEGYHELFERACADIDDVTAGRTGASRAAGRMYAGLRATGLVPAGLPLADESLRFMHPGPADLVRLRRWGRRDAPDEVRPLLGRLGGGRGLKRTANRGSER